MFSKIYRYEDIKEGFRGGLDVLIAGSDPVGTSPKRAVYIGYYSDCGSETWSMFNNFKENFNYVVFYERVSPYAVGLINHEFASLNTTSLTEEKDKKLSFQDIAEIIDQQIVSQPEVWKKDTRASI
ncbi:hypothetical protein KY348_07070 [Candidatus Woesearchaeota archaeon]|nr:hypothetical protein [Candidatus Woesearchaeota archaeon]